MFKQSSMDKIKLILAMLRWVLDVGLAGGPKSNSA